MVKSSVVVDEVDVDVVVVVEEVVDTRRLLVSLSSSVSPPDTLPDSL